MTTTLPPKLVRTMFIAGGIILCGNPIADRLDLKFWQPIIWENCLRVFAYQQQTVPAEVVFFGSSRTESAITPLVAEEEYRNLTGKDVTTYSLAQPGTNLVAAAWLLRDTIASTGPPRVVVLELTISSVNSNREFYFDLEWYSSISDLFSLLPHLRSPGHLRSACRGLLRGWSSLASRALISPRSEKSRQRLSRILEARGAGISTSKSLLDDTAEDREAWLDEKRQRQRTLVLKDYRIGGVPVAALERVFGLCQTPQCRVALVNPPVHVDFRNIYQQDEADIFSRFVHDLGIRRGVAYYDFGTDENLSRLGLTEADFRDFSHLNRTGSEKYSRALARQVLVPELTSR